MAHPKQVWQDVEITLEFIETFDPKKLLQTHPGLLGLLGEFLIGPPRRLRSPEELEVYAGLNLLEAKLPQLRLDFLETKRLGQALDGLFGALEFNVIGRRVTPVRHLGPLESPNGWRSKSGVWLCHRPLCDALDAA
jgi:hypothetical protein